MQNGSLLEKVGGFSFFMDAHRLLAVGWQQLAMELSVVSLLSRRLVLEIC